MNIFLFINFYIAVLITGSINISRSLGDLLCSKICDTDIDANGENLKAVRV